MFIFMFPAMHDGFLRVDAASRLWAWCFGMPLPSLGDIEACNRQQNPFNDSMIGKEKKNLIKIQEAAGKKTL